MSADRAAHASAAKETMKRTVAVGKERRSALGRRTAEKYFASNAATVNVRPSDVRLRDPLERPLRGKSVIGVGPLQLRRKA